MEDKYIEHLGRRLEKIQNAQTTIQSEKRAAGELYKDYINSLGTFPQWLAIFSGAAGVLGIFNQVFLIFAFISFLFSASLLLYIKKKASESVIVYINSMSKASKAMADLTHGMVKFRKNEITEEEMQKIEKEFEGQYEEIKSRINLPEVKSEKILTSLSFYLNIIGTVFLILSLIWSTEFLII